MRRTQGDGRSAQECYDVAERHCNGTLGNRVTEVPLEASRRHHFSEGKARPKELMLNRLTFRFLESWGGRRRHSHDRDVPTPVHGGRGPWEKV